MVAISKIGVVGAGQMGNGIAHVCALGGYSVWLHDTTDERINAGLATIDGNLARQVSSGRITEEERKQAIGRIQPALSLDQFNDVDLAIESINEDEALKRSTFADLSAALPQRAILATNTSSISITRLAAATDRPERFIGMHFMNPVPVMELVELVRGIATDDATFETAKTFAAKLGKQTAVSEDFPAFIVNRILLPMINEAIYTLYEGVGTVDGIDTAMRLGANHPMGPLQLADFIGLDIFHQQRTRPVFRIGEPFVEHLHDRQAGIETDEVGQLQRSHRMMGTEPHGGIDCLDRADAFVEGIDRLIDHRQQDAVDDKGRIVFGDRDRLADPGDERLRRFVG
jgi:3-hydroxybutyryl-CoA dehydrogenase